LTRKSAALKLAAPGAMKRQIFKSGWMATPTKRSAGILEVKRRQKKSKTQPEKVENSRDKQGKSPTVTIKNMSQFPGWHCDESRRSGTENSPSPIGNLWFDLAQDRMGSFRFTPATLKVKSSPQSQKWKRSTLSSL